MGSELCQFGLDTGVDNRTGGVYWSCREGTFSVRNSLCRCHGLAECFTCPACRIEGLNHSFNRRILGWT